MLDGIECLGHSTIKINKIGQVIYVDPYNVRENKNDADIIFITHNHYDHYSPEDINRVRKENTIMVVTKDLYEDTKSLEFDEMNIIIVEPNKNYKISDINISTVPAYNLNKKFHPKVNEWVGYILEIDGIRYYIAGDTDITEENKKVECDVAFVPVGGTYTMDSKEAAGLINQIQPKIAIPIHYGSIVGTEQDAIDFKGLLNDGIECKIMIELMKGIMNKEC